jgi:predicted RNA-binding protein YlxR (DUF448 family)
MAEMREPSRRCIACRQSIGKAQLVRFSYVDGGIQYDSDGRLGGRGAYLHPHLLCVQKAARDLRCWENAFRLPKRSLGSDRIRSLVQLLESNDGLVGS